MSQVLFYQPLGELIYALISENVNHSKGSSLIDHRQKHSTLNQWKKSNLHCEILIWLNNSVNLHKNWGTVKIRDACIHIYTVQDFVKRIYTEII